MAIKWHYINDYLAIGLDWQFSGTATQLKITPKVYRWDKYNTDNYGGRYSEVLSPDPSGAGSWSGLTFGSGSGTRCIDTFDTRTYNRTHAKQSLSFKISWTNIGTYYSGSYHNLGSGSYTWTDSVDPLASYPVTYSANGGSGAPAQQTKWYGESLTLSSTTPTRTGYTFQGWGTSESDTTVDYAAGASYTGNAAMTLYAIWKANTYTISFNANGGTGAPASQTKTYGVALTLSSTEPTRANYNFLGWATSSTATTATYDPGDSFTTNAATTLYAVWELAYVKPTISGMTVGRCLSDGTNDDFGTYVKVAFNWECSQLAGSNPVSAITVEWKEASATTWSSQAVSASGTSGSVSVIVGSNAISVDGEYTVRATVTDSMGGSTSMNRSVATANFILDFLAGGNGIAIGKAATVDGALDVYKQTIIRGSEDASASSSSGQLVVGDPEGLHLAFDSNEIMAKTNATEQGQLNIQADGGTTSLGGSLVAAESVYMRNGKILYSKNASGADRSMIQSNDSNQYFFGYGSYANNEGQVYFDGNAVNIRSKGAIAITSPTAGLNLRQYGVNKVLLSTASYMNASQTYTLSEAVSAQPNGIVLMWSRYNSSSNEKLNDGWTAFFVPKGMIPLHGGCYRLPCSALSPWWNMSKVVTVNDTQIVGFAVNEGSQTNSPVTWNASNYVLRYVIGV